MLQAKECILFMPYKKLRWLFSCLLAVLCLLTVLSAQADPVFQVTLKSSKITLSAGETKIIDYTVTASSDVVDKTLTFASSSTDIVTVDSTGQLTAKSVGYANITITHAAEPKVELTCQVEVVSSSTMALNLYSVVLPINGTVQLTGTTSSAALPVTYSTSDPKVCTVDASTGIVKAVGEGTAQILAANAHGVKAVCEVKVSKTKPDGAVTPTPAPTTPPSGGQAAFVNTVSGSLNLRSAPSLYATVLRTIPEKAAFTVLEYGSDWCKAQYGSTVGYVMTKFLVLGTGVSKTSLLPDTISTPNVSTYDRFVAVDAAISEHDGIMNGIALAPQGKSIVLGATDTTGHPLFTAGVGSNTVGSILGGVANVGMGAYSVWGK